MEIWSTLVKKDNVRETVYAFNDTNVVATYDVDMDVWHPNRAKIAAIVCELLPFHRAESVSIVDLGAGTGYLTQRLLETFPNATIIAVDAAELMIEKAKIRLKDHLRKVVFQISSFQELPYNEYPFSPIDAVVSSFAFHHLYREEKLTLYKYIHSILKPNGWFVNCDIMKASDAVLEARFRYLHHLGIRQRMKTIKHQDKSLDQISSELAEKEKRDGDNPLFLTDDLQLVMEAGFRTAECFWKEYREAIYGGIK